MKKSSLLLTILIISISIFIYGVFVGVYKIFPYDVLDYVKVIILNEKNEFNSKEDFYYERDVSRLIHINTVDDIGKLKNNLIDFIWKYDGFPDSQLPNNVQKNIVNPLYDDFINLKQIDQIDVNMEYGINSIAYLFIPESSNDILIIYHEGHAFNGFESGTATIQFFLNKGYTVMAFSMPLTGMNDDPIVDLPNLGKFKLERHSHFAFLDTSDFSSIKFFMEPIAVSLNYLDKNYNFSSYNMIGFSGGGWTVTLYSAIDDRIAQTYSVAGSVPIYLRTIGSNLGDYEQWNPELYQIANYLDLYIMSSYGEDKKFIQIFNKYDTCCFSGEFYKTYENEVKEVLSKLNIDHFDIFLDDTHRTHKISDRALEIIIQSMLN
jgi:hypothetical protein